MLPVVRNYIRSDQSQCDCIYAIEEFFLTNEHSLKPIAFIKCIQYLYEKDLFDEDTILDWYSKPKSLPDHEIEQQKKLRTQKEVQMFVSWLQEAEEESSEED